MEMTNELRCSHPGAPVFRKGTHLAERHETAFKTQVTFVTDDFAEVVVTMRFAKLVFGGTVSANSAAVERREKGSA